MGNCQYLYIKINLIYIEIYIYYTKRSNDMIVYDKLWETLKEKKISQYKLIKTYHISTGQLDRLRKNENVSTYTLNQLCEILDCELSDIAKYKRNPTLKDKTNNE